MSTWGQRIGLAEQHEQAVIAELQRLGWTAEPFGQALLSERMRDELRRQDTLLRWLPDVIAVNHELVCLVDGKASLRRDTPNHSIEAASLECGLALSRLFCPVYYVWDDWLCATAIEVERHAGPVLTSQRNGSGTPFRLLRKSDCRPFATAFSSRLAA